jgi:hypothetical protein
MDTTVSPPKEAKFTDPFYSRSGVVCFVSAGSGCETCKSIKVGVSTREGLLRRLRTIQSANHTRVRLLRVIEFSTMLQAEAKEKDIHKLFKDSARVPHGAVGAEWFTETEELRRYIEEHGAPLKQMAETLADADIITQLFTII